MKQKRPLGTLFVLVAGLCVACGLDDGIPSIDEASSPAMVVTFLDVGQGDAALFQLPGGETVLIDGGPDEAGEQVILPYLESLEIDHLDLLVVTHSHADHVGGLDEVLSGVGVDEIWENGEVASSVSWANYREAVRAAELVPLVVVPGHRTGFGSVELLVLGADNGMAQENNDSLVVRVSFGDMDILMTGDVETEGQELLIQNQSEWLGCEILKVPHHGSASFEPLFLTAVSPDAAVISCGLDNVYGHPAQSVLEALAAVGASVCRTDLGGDAVFQVTATDFRTDCF